MTDRLIEFNRMQRGATLASLVLVATALTACGGGGGGSQSNPPPAVNQPPVLTPGPVQTVLEQRTVNLSVTATDADGTVTTILWTQEGAPTVVLTGANTLTPSFTAPAVSTQTPLNFRVVVTDDDGAQALTIVSVFVDPDPLLNLPPVANAGVDLRILPDVVRSVSGAGSSDPDGILVSFQWVQVGSAPLAQLLSPNSSTLNFIVPRPAADAIVTFELHVTDNEGATDTDTVDILVVANNAPPVPNAGVNQSVFEQRGVTLAGSATDADGTVESYAWQQLPGPTPFVQIQNANTSTASFQSPAVNGTVMLTFSLTVTDDLGTQATDFVSITINADPALNMLPVADAGPDRSAAFLVVVPLAGQGSDPDDILNAGVQFQWVQTAGDLVTLSSTTAPAPSFTSPATPTQLSFQLTVTDNEGATDVDTVDVAVDPGPLSGRITYDRVPFSMAGSGLDYNSIIEAPVRGAVVEAIDNVNNILATTTTDANGNYSFTPPVGSLLLRVKAQMVQTGSPGWNFRVLNNVNFDALYAVQGTEQLYLGGATTLNLRAASGWTGAGYTQTRAAAPFSLLDVAYEVRTLVLSANPSAQFPPLDIHWSPENRPSDFFNPASGEIITTHYAAQNVYVLGQQDNDTDEYDQHVIAHELGHYLQDIFSRDDSIGGPHGPGDRLDLRVAFSEGWGNAFSGMVKNDPRYRDSFGFRQGIDFDINVESDQAATPGWFSEESVQSILYDLFDATADANDGVTLGFGPVFAVLSTDLPAVEPLTSIFPFVSHLRANNPGAVAGIDAVVTAQQIVSITIDELGSTETSNGGNAQNLPVYRAATINGGSQQVCSSTTNGEYNKLGNAKFLRFNVPTDQTVTITADSTATPPNSDPDMALYRQGFITESIADSTANGIEQFSIPLTPGNYILEVYEFFATDLFPTPSGNTCMNVTITSP